MIKILDSSKLKERSDNNFKFDEKGRKVSKWVENAVEEGEIARNSLFHSVFYPFGKLSALFIKFEISPFSIVFSKDT